MAYIIINIQTQTLSLWAENGGKQLKEYAISSALNGIGSLENTGCTPLGKHTISEKFGGDAPINSVFVARQATGEIYSDELAKAHPNRDWILSRILWLDGCELGVNKGTTADNQVCDTKARYIYIHGTPDTEPMGIAQSHGCIRMRNADIIELFNLVSVNDEVEILDI